MDQIPAHCTAGHPPHAVVAAVPKKELAIGIRHTGILDPQAVHGPGANIGRKYGRFFSIAQRKLRREHRQPSALAADRIAFQRPAGSVQADRNAFPQAFILGNVHLQRIGQKVRQLFRIGQEDRSRIGGAHALPALFCGRQHKMPAVQTRDFHFPFSSLAKAAPTHMSEAP
ncbi:hypothetical protein SDC9_200714 [bioreactor metagenome]|uniref:Uncharacterized protein n=1 Tax=bioreactor metagenome TaxID=1076179 RepID=A0A645IP00_9ZZZZ